MATVGPAGGALAAPRAVPRHPSKRDEYILTAKIWLVNIALFGTVIMLGALG